MSCFSRYLYTIAIKDCKKRLCQKNDEETRPDLRFEFRLNTDYAYSVALHFA